MSERNNGKIDYYSRYGFYPDELQGVMKLPEKKPHHPPIDSIRTLQDITGHASARLAPHETPQDILVHLQQEIVELSEAIQIGTRKEVGSELPDIVILAFRIADMYGVDMSEALTKKVERNAYKYSMGMVQELVDQGLTYEEARLKLKREWDRSRDSDFT